MTLAQLLKTLELWEPLERLAGRLNAWLLRVDTYRRFRAYGVSPRKAWKIAGEAEGMARDIARAHGLTRDELLARLGD